MAAPHGRSHLNNGALEELALALPAPGPIALYPSAPELYMPERPVSEATRTRTLSA